MNTFFSLIVPVYNVEKYLERCLDSIFHQDYENFEVICINDGSKDKSSEILHNYSLKHSNLKVINQENKGLGRARNAGLEICQGEFVWFIDSDDWIASNSLSTINAFLNENPTIDVLLINMIRTSDGINKKTLYNIPSRLRNKSVNRKDYISSLLLYDGLYAAQSKLFRRNIICGFRFSEGFYEDVPLLILFHEKMNIGYVEGEFYYYYQRNGSIVSTVDKRVLDIFKQYDLVYQCYQDCKEFQRYLGHFLYYLSIITFIKGKTLNDKGFVAIIKREFHQRKKLVPGPFKIAKMKEVSLKRKIKILLYSFMLNH